MPKNVEESVKVEVYPATAERWQDIQVFVKTADSQSVHPTLGILHTS